MITAFAGNFLIFKIRIILHIYTAPSLPAQPCNFT